MTTWHWLTQFTQTATRGTLIRLLIKSVIFFVLINGVFVLLQPLPAINRLSIYNWLVPGRDRLPYGENATLANNLSVNSLEAMFASHEINTPQAEDEFRVAVMGDSGTWGILLRPDETISAWLNQQNLTHPNGQRLVFYNLGYPTMSLTKDLLLLDRALAFEPDAILWLVTAQSFPRPTQLDAPLVTFNPQAITPLVEAYDLNLDLQDARFERLDVWDQTLVGRRRELADWIRLQFYGFVWASSGQDQYYPPEYTPLTVDYDEDLRWGPFATEQTLTRDDLALDMLEAGFERAGETPIWLVNEAMFISDGVNSDLRYNFFYPRWAYDQYRELVSETAETHQWPYLNLWDVVAPSEFTDSPVHMTLEGVAQMGTPLAEWIQAQLQSE